MKEGGFLGLVVLFYTFLVGMGGLGGPASVRVREPARNYAATVTDQSDIVTRLEKFSFEGETILSGKMGDAHISISFEKIGWIGFLLQDDTLTAEVHLKEGKAIPLVVENGAACYGKLPYADFKIGVEDIKSITMHGEVAGKNVP